MSTDTNACPMRPHVPRGSAWREQTPARKTAARLSVRNAHRGQIAIETQMYGKPHGKRWRKPYTGMEPIDAKDL